MPLQLIFIGLISILGQVVIIRELSVASFGIELIYILAIGAWLLLTGIGATLGRRTFQPERFHVAGLFLLLGVIFPLNIMLLRGIRNLFGGVPGAYLPFLQQIAALFIVLTPTCLILGLLFQWAAKIYVRESGKTLAIAYAIESAGGVVGGLASTLFLKWGIQNLNQVLMCGILSLGMVLFYREIRLNIMLRIPAVLLLLLLGFLAGKANEIDFALTKWNHLQLAATRDTPYGRVSITSTLDQLSVFENDALSYESEGTAAEEFASLSVIHHRKPRRILLLGGAGGLILELQKYNPARLDYVELNPAMFDLVRSFLDDPAEQALTAQNVKLYFTDPRTFLKSDGKYDLIMIAMPDPTSGQSNRFYTREFFQSCKARLAAEGIITFRLRSAENLWTPQLKNRTSSIYRAVTESFDHVTVLPGVTNIFIASDSSLPVDYSMPVKHLYLRDVQNRLVTPDYVRYLYTNDRFHQIKEILKNEDAPTNRDNRPICYQYALMIWLSKFFPSLAFREMKLSNSLLAMLIAALGIVILAAFLISRQKEMMRRSMLVGTAGLVGMVVETVLILHYQTKSGVLYQDIGLLLIL